ncbi:small kinetochore-associated protein [Nelusetta ayraudi]|uniref:small kinetochore-associated protein n=1 Tax=Nelusetta ayraudi TaxID=303726 RepID=UPI003F72ADB8
MSSKIPKGTQLSADTKKTGHKNESKDTATTASSDVGHKSDGILKTQKENMPRKITAAKTHKGVSTRYGQQAELKEQNQHLVATNEELKKNLTDTQQRMMGLEQQYSDLEKENEGLHKNLKDCHVLLVAAKVDPVLGERVGEAAQGNEIQRKEVMSVSENLLQELNRFVDVASQQRARLEEFQTLMMDLATARQHMKEERENFSREAAEMENALKEAEALLL